MADEDSTEQEVRDKLYRTTDAKVWAEEWCKIALKIHEEQGVEAVIDEGWMIGWFANAFGTVENHTLRNIRESFEQTGARSDRAFGFDYEEDGSLSLESAIFQTLGYASMCWSKTPEGIFDSTRAKDAGDKLVDFVKSLRP